MKEKENSVEDPCSYKYIYLFLCQPNFLNRINKKYIFTFHSLGKKGQEASEIIPIITM